ncbi:putative alpha/beta hydrolase family esterase [Kribbella aluminosa]|uniref:Alpha/beta hydrolase family esterase n=1 Tax=Kribbella aluminosa TaxID=416017 RepID=A0ABS4UYI8_9ACTN|nr:alpha/beta hydrolase [Kribbella aluminosa]MBP2356663.1 putative alpha/beta hydrolase family esterase [Kribbella aluminosa]
MTFIIIPGLDGSDEHHWQSVWEASLPAVRIQPTSWSAPDLTDWSNAITRAAEDTTGDIIFITHSLGCHALAHWLTSADTAASRRPLSARVRGAFLVAPPDPLAPTFPVDRLPTFTSLPAVALGVPAVLVASTDDPYCTIDAATRLANSWQAPLIPLDHLGHINTETNLGPWPPGHHLLTTFLAGLAVD